MTARIVIKDQEYSIQLKKEDYSIDFLADFVRRIQAGEGVYSGADEEDIKSKSLSYQAELRFDDLEDK